MSATETVVSVFVGGALAFSLVAPPGPMNALIADETVARGWTAGVRAGLGAFVADAVFCALAFSGAATVAGSTAVRIVASLVGGVFMLYLAYAAVRDVHKEATVGSRGFLKALFLGLTNPYQIGWWLTAGVSIVRPSSVDLAGMTVVVGGITVLVGFFLGIVVWITAFPALLVRVGERLEEFKKPVGYVSAAILAFFGVVFIYYATTL